MKIEFVIAKELKKGDMILIADPLPISALSDSEFKGLIPQKRARNI